MCRLAPRAPIPVEAAKSNFFCVVRTGDELSVVCAEDCAPDGAVVERGWIALQLQGPFPFSLTGVLASFLQPLDTAQIPILAISTFDTDYILIKHGNLDRAVLALSAAGHERIGD